MSIQSFNEIEKLWSTRAQFARVIDVNQEIVRKWAERDKIPSAYWSRVVRACHEIDAPVTYKQLAEMADIDRNKKNPRKART